MKKIAIDSGPLSSGHNVRGIGTYVRELTKFLNNVDIVDFTVSKKLFSEHKYDVFHFTSFKPFVVSLPVSKPSNVKFILTIYDLIPLIYPKHYPPGLRGGLNWEINKNLIKRNVDAVVTISETSKKDICRFTGIAPEKVFVTYLASRPIFQKIDRPKFPGLPKKFALYVGDVNYNKNIPNLIKACELAKIPLVIAGKQAKEIENLDLNHSELKHLKNLNWDNVIRLGYVSEEDLVNLYNLADVYVQASYYEGFSLPTLEAVACKTPLAVSKNQCHVEILGDDFKYFNPDDPKGIAESILHPNRLTKPARNYSWQKTAEDTMAVYEKI